jgi:hypothetical protein
MFYVRKGLYIATSKGISVELVGPDRIVLHVISSDGYLGSF